MYIEAIKQPDIQKWEKCMQCLIIVTENYTDNDTYWAEQEK